MTAVFPVGLGTAACRGPKYFFDWSYLPFGFVSVKLAPETVEADVRLGTDVWIRLPRVVILCKQRLLGLGLSGRGGGGGAALDLF